MEDGNARPHGAWAHRKRFLEDLFRKRGLRPQRRLGQNFLLDSNLLDFIVRSAAPGPKDTVLEVGVGTGQMTGRLASRAGKVVGVEKDRLLFEIATEALASADNVQLIHADVLASKNRIRPDVEMTFLAARPEPPGRLIMASNLAYSIATPLILNLLASTIPVRSMVATVQRELGEKLGAQKPGDPGYGPVSLLTRYHANARILRILPPGVFWPRPKVDSAIVRIEAREPGDRPFVPFDLFRKVVKGVFTQRRKTIHKSLVSLGFAGKGGGEPLAWAAGLDPSARPEALSFDDFLGLAHAIREGQREDRPMAP